ncbi:hypothetical protein VE00_03233 [Pseudogymnoascus sp. WSF 3629]|nr:hypothetical protein VE00_03233 [Pseudogymnoascus sp. WSF 3629]
MDRASKHKKWEKFTIPSEVLATLPNTCTSAPLLQLPTEILITIFDEVEIINQLALALTCKRLLQVSTLVSLDVSDLVVRKPDTLGLRELLFRLGPTTEDWRICIHCTKFRPTRQSYWKAKADLEKWTEAENRQGWMMAIIHLWEHFYGGSCCPECMAKDGCFS